MVLEEKMFNVGGSRFGMVMWADSLMEFFFFDGGCLGKLTGTKKELVAIEMVVGVVERAV